MIFFLLFFVYAISGYGVTLIDFGTTAAGNRFELNGWDQLLLSEHMTYTHADPGGVILNSEFEEFSDYMGVQGTLRSFVPGERIVVTWTNHSDEPITFTSRISFDDTDQPNGGVSDGSWFTMRNSENYRHTYTQIQPHATARTVFHIRDSGVHKSDGSHSVVNINLHIEWFETAPKRYLVCNSIQLLSDADIRPPDAPDGLTATAVSDSKIKLDWKEPNDNQGVYDYLIYCNGEIEGYAVETEYTAVFLEPAQNYTFYVTAKDQAGNESEPSDPVTGVTQPFQSGPDLINPAFIQYQGAFRLPDVFFWGGEAIAFCPAQPAGGNTDNQSFGTLFVTNLNQPENGLVGQVRIPKPVMISSKNFNDLPVADLLQSPVNIRPSTVDTWEYVDVWRTGLEYVTAENRLYSTWSIHYTVTGEKHASISCCPGPDLSTGPRYGAWYVGDPSRPPIDAMMGDYLFQVPQEWALEHLAGKSLIAGRFRDGGLSGLGPGMYALAPVGTEPPPPNSVLNYTPLLKYGAVEETDMITFPHSVDGFRLSDAWRDADWISTTHQNAVMIAGNKARGDHWYGYFGENMHHEWVIADVPYPEFYETDPNGKGWRSHNLIPMAIFYDPSDLAAVATNDMASYEPQPYAAKRFDRTRFWHQNCEIRSLAFDEQNRLLYVLEFDPDHDGALVVHVWDINEKTTETGPAHDQKRQSPQRITLYQNHPNPFNSTTRIRYELPERQFVSIDIYDIRGNHVRNLVNQEQGRGVHRIEWQGTDERGHPCPSGIYFYRIQTPFMSRIRKMTILN